MIHMRTLLSLFVFLIASAIAREPAGERSCLHDRLQFRTERALEDHRNRAHADVIPIEEQPEYATSALFPTLIYHPGTDHFAINVSPKGDTLEMQDGSIWHVKSNDRNDTKEWLRSDVLNLMVNDSWFSSFDYKLKNLNTGHIAYVNLSLPPLMDSPYTNRIYDIDYDRNSITLADGSLWEMSWFDDKIVAKWKRDDIVILGHNDGWWKSLNPYIILNVHDLKHARGARTK